MPKGGFSKCQIYLFIIIIFKFEVGDFHEQGKHEHLTDFFPNEKMINSKYRKIMRSSI